MPRSPTKNLEVYVDVPLVSRVVMDYVDVPPRSSSKPKPKSTKQKPSISQNRTIDNYFTSNPVQKRALPATTTKDSNQARRPVPATGKDTAVQAHRSPHKRALSDRPINVEIVDLITPAKKRKAIDNDVRVEEKAAKKPKITSGAEVDIAAPTRKVHVPPTTTEPEAPQDKPVVKRVRKKVVPKWMPIEGFDDREEAESRIQLREFLIRFRPILKLAKSHYEGLDEFSTFSEDTAKAIIKAMLDLIVADATGDERSNINTTLKSISACGTDLYKIWQHTRKLCTDTFHLDLLTPPVSPVAKQTRNGPSHVLHPGQLVDCMLSLIDVALNSPSIREEIQEGDKEYKDKTKVWFKAVKEESERWSEQRGKLLFTKPQKPATDAPKDEQVKQQQLEKAYKANYAHANKEHKANLRAINGAYFQVACANSSRFEPLGRDLEGRVYYILSPVQGGRVPAKSTRDDLMKWAWLVACFGKRPHTDGADKADVDDVDDKWWGFADAEEIRKLAKWVEATDDVPKGAPTPVDTKSNPPRSSGTQLATLSKGLLGFADYLEWRTGSQEEEVPTKKEVPARRFYGS